MHSLPLLIFRIILGRKFSPLPIPPSPRALFIDKETETQEGLRCYTFSKWLAELGIQPRLQFKETIYLTHQYIVNATDIILLFKKRLGTHFVQIRQGDMGFCPRAEAKLELSNTRTTCFSLLKLKTKKTLLILMNFNEFYFSSILHGSYFA